MVGLFGFQVRNARFASYFRITEDKLTQSWGVNINWGNGEFILGALTYLNSVMFIKGTQKMKYRKLCHEFKLSIV